MRDVESWAITVVAQTALDTLRSGRLRREHYIGPWPPEPSVKFEADDADPAGAGRRGPPRRPRRLSLIVLTFRDRWITGVNIIRAPRQDPRAHQLGATCVPQAKPLTGSVVGCEPSQTPMLEVLQWD